MARRIVQISDLHFGADDPSLVEPLLRSLEDLRPDLVVVSGDLTQRATAREFEAARALVARLPAPAFIVPGNHDIPLWNAALRFAAPRHRWDRALGVPWCPTWMDGETIVTSIDTPRAWRRKEGAVSLAQLERLRAELAKAPKTHRRIVVTHHPLAPVEGLGAGHPLALGAHRARHALRDCGTDLVLSGHLHVSGLHRIAEANRKGLLFLQCPSTLSHRLRGERNGFVVVDLVPDGIESTLVSYHSDQGAFVRGQTVGTADHVAPV